jgi:hypothetical protein
MNPTPDTQATNPRKKEEQPTFYVWINGKLRHLLPAPDISAALAWVDEQYPYAREREIYRCWRLA